jgi:L-asparaginase
MKSVSKHSFDQDEIHIFTTGGTIEGLEYDSPDDRVTQVAISLEEFLKTAKVSFKYSITPVFSKDSRFITDQDRTQLANKIRASGHSKILITHGTLTMVETARFLGQLKLDKTIVLVGAFTLGTKTETDAPFNLGFSLAALQFLEHGVFIAMNGKLFNWDKVIKNTNTNNFESLPD